MTLNLVRRSTKGSLLTAADHDGNLDKLETAIEADSIKLSGIAPGATANSTDAQLRDRSTHTGTQAWNTIIGTPTTLAGYGITDALTAAAAGTTYQPLSANLTALGANGTAFYLSRANHTGTQAASTITGLATVATSGAYSDLSGRPTLFDPASPGAIGSTTPAAGSFTSLTASVRLGLPSGAPAIPAARDLYAVTNTLRYRDSTGAERLLLNSGDNLANLANAATARTNLGLGSLATQSGTFSGASSGTNTGDQTITLTGDVTGTGTGTFAATLTATSVVAGTYGSSSQVGSFTVDSKGRLTAASNISLSLASTAISDSTAAGRALLTGADAAAQRTSLGLGTFATANVATPPAIGGTTPAAAAFTGLTLPQQASPPATPSTGFVLFANSSNALGWRGANGFLRVFDGTGNTADRTYTLPDEPGTFALTSDLPAVASTSTAGLMPATSFAAISYAASVALDMTALDGQVRSISLTGDLTLTTSNQATGRTLTLRLVADATQRTLTFPAGWVFVGTKPSNIAASKTGVLSLTFFGTADTDCVAAWGVQA